MFLGPKPKLADFLVKCLLPYKTLFYKNLDPKTYPCWHKDPKTEKIHFFFKWMLFLGLRVKCSQVWRTYVQ